MPTLIPALAHETGFAVGDSDVRFGLLWPEGVDTLPDWTINSEPVVRKGAGIVITQFIDNDLPRQITYRVVFDTVAQAKRLDLLIQQTGTLTLYHGSHTAPVPQNRQHQVRGQQYDRIDDCTLMTLANREVFQDGTVEIDATWWLDG